MSTTTATTKEFFNEYFKAMCGKPKDAAGVDKYVADPVLKKHILETEQGFPAYDLKIEEMVTEGNMAAVKMLFTGVHKGTFAGIAPTGKAVSAGAMGFYQVENGKIQKFSILIDVPVLMAQLQG
jgi:predicted ester cyclase